MRFGKKFTLSITIFFVPIFLLTVGCFRKTEKTYHIGILSGIDIFSGITDGFKEKMTELGYVEGKNIIYNIYRAPAPVGNEITIKKFVDEKVDLILSFPTEAALEAKSVAQDSGIPIVFVNVLLEDTNLVKSIREPGGNITGVRWPGPDIVLKGFEFIRELVPKAKKILIPYMKDYPSVNSQLKVLRKAYKAAGLKMIEISAVNTAELKSALEKLSYSNSIPDAIEAIIEPLCVMPDSFIILAKFASEHRIPLCAGAYISFGGYESLFQYTPDFVPQGRQAALLANKILKGTPAGTLPVISAECYLTINYRAAKKLGLNVSEELLIRANEIIR